MKRFILAVCAGLMMLFFCAAAESGNYASTEILVRCNTKYEGELSIGKNGRYFEATNPRKGKLVLNENGHFSYTPDRDFTGKDYFGYRIADEKGNISEEQTVIIKVSRN